MFDSKLLRRFYTAWNHLRCSCPSNRQPEGLCNHYAARPPARLLPRAYLAPDIAETILAGRQGYGVSLADLTAQPLPFSWLAQRDLVAQLGMGGTPTAGNPVDPRVQGRSRKMNF